MSIFHRPENAVLGDVIPFYDEGVFKPFYLRNFRHNRDKDHQDSWVMLTTTDHVHFTEHDTKIVGGTGSVIKVDGVYHMFYCTFRQYPERNYINHAISYDLDTFMDWENGTCSFDSEEFRSLLKFASKFPTEFDSENFDWESMESPYARMKSGKQLLMDASIHSFDDVQFHAGILENNISYIGYPTSSGSGSSFACSGTLSISTSCENVDAAWSLVRTLLLEDYQIKDHMYNFPTNKHAFDAYVEMAMEAEYTTDPETGELVEVSQEITC